MPVSPADRALIEERFNRYMWAIDTGDVDGLLACFTDDAIMDSPVAGRIRDHSEIRKMAERFARLPGMGVQLRHAISNMIIEGDGERADARCYLAVFITRDGASRLMAPGRYACRLSKTSGEWLFTERVVVMDHDFTIEGL